MIKEFKDFISRGNVVDMAVGIIVGAAFTSIVKSLVNNLINPLIGLFIGKIDLSNLVWTIGDAQFKYGSFLNSVINFLIISFVIFLMVKAINRFRKKKEEEPAKLSEEAQYLKEITELLKKNESK
ncbi:large-conductance mechanosensitive channel protein MscL [Limosilactobacillus fastidiosus]|uniref:Large-conductance mechanosensitive channel n=1 Tax=Limosilactobacillus fastidiosus TaxID=2759855 RepID=A0A7W3U022_9LACO|nr:large-conductance mechanosensitive channel protein MscL [Limosilactobacillus fastidiosus]MBB1062919.1 large-conductance mechanosensitive channel protein MscL [Limosilactobacillus fastidiosus]MBB1086170.1 large-conductance mechanosensitive channel protein MscL [Limosilactobacillus fastidiosus]MCD7083765.1 large-conductance mechanosensitive channel protein MscL [Limosilactobacillus fastidiosus]MCD7085085.1 large-conductance mechanosensitive channel protein MscL [Limosilactobacillus fastidiosus